jgi:hypothetical protein
MVDAQLIRSSGNFQAQHLIQHKSMSHVPLMHRAMCECDRTEAVLDA